MRSIIFFILVASFKAQAGGILMIDLNDSDREIKACSDGVAANNEAKGTDDDVYSLSYGSSFVTNKNGETTGKRRVDEKYVDDALTQLEAQGVNVDTIVISGHDGSGHFFGKHGGSILSSAMKRILDKHQKTKASLESMALWGCYTTNDNGCQNYWMKKVSPNIKTAIGFTLQSPDNTRPGNFQLLKDYCKKRDEINKAQTAEELTDQFNHLDNVKNWNVGICRQDGVCSTEYRRKGDKTCFHSYQELQERCNQDFDPDHAKTGIYEKYLEANTEGFKDPPKDGESDYTTTEKMLSGGKSLHKKNELRAYYNQLHLWRHCAEQFKAESGFDMPVPAQVIRLIKFDVLKKNIADLHAKQIAQYNQKLRALGLDQFVLEPLDQMSRAEVVSSTRGAVAALEQLAGAKGTAPLKKKVVQTAKEQDDESPDLTSSGSNGEGLLTPLDEAPRKRTPVKRIEVAQPEEAPPAADTGGSSEASRVLKMARGFDKTLRMLDWHCTDFSLVHEDATTRSTCIPSY